MNFNPLCYSSSPTLGKRGILKRDEFVINEISKLIAEKTAYKKEFKVNLNKALMWTPVRLYNKFWLDGDNAGIMLHPYTRLPLWLNSDGDHPPFYVPVITSQISGC